MAPQPTDAYPLNPATKPSPVVAGLIYALAGSRLAAGALGIFMPQTTSSLFGLETLPGATLMTRLFGVREAVVGGLTIATCNNPVSKKDLRRVVWAGVAVDALDALACLIVLSSSTTEVAAAKTPMVGGLGCVLLGLFTIWSID